MLAWLRATGRPHTMRLILIITLAGVLAANPCHANRRLETMVENPKVTDKLMPATFLMDGKFTLQLFVSFKPVEEVAVRRRTILTNRRKTNRKEMPSNVKDRLRGHQTLVSTQVANKNRTANEGRLKTTTSRYPTSKSSEEEDDPPWESWKTKNVTVKGAIQPASNRTTSIPIPRARFSRIQTTPAHSSKDARRTRFMIEQGHGNSPEMSRAKQNQDQDPTVVDGTMFKLQEEDKDADPIDWRIASRNGKTEQVQTDGNSDPIYFKQDGHFSEESQTEFPILKHSVVGFGSPFDQATPATEVGTPTAALKLPLPLNQPIARESLAFDVTADSEGQFFPSTQMVIKETIRDSTATDSSIGNPIVEITHTDMVSTKFPTPLNRRVAYVKESDKVEESSIKVENEARKKQIARNSEMVNDRVSNVKVRRPSWSDSEEHGVFWVRYLDEQDDFTLEHERFIDPINLKKKKIVIVNRNRDGRGTGGQSRRDDTYPKKESPYFYYHYDTSNALATGSCYLPLLIASVLFLFCCDTILCQMYMSSSFVIAACMVKQHR